VGVVVLAAWPALSLGFWNPDDWLHIDVAAGLSSLDPAAFAHAWYGYAPTDGLRLAPYVLWVIDYLLFGFSPRGYYATNLLLHVATAVAVFEVGRRLGGTAAHGLAAGAVFALNPATSQSLYFLSAREDALCALLYCAAVAAWPVARRTRTGAAAIACLFTLACLSKLPAVTLPAVLLSVEMVLRRRGRGAGAEPPPPWRQQVLPLVAAVLVFTACVVMLGPVGGLLDDRPPADPGLVLRRLQLITAPGAGLLGDGIQATDRWLRWTVAAAAIAAVAWRRPPVGLLVVGAVWLVVCLPVPAPWLLHDANAGDLGGRYLLLPSVGVALLVAGLLPRATGSGRAGTGARIVSAVLALALLGVTSVGFVRIAHPNLDLQKSMVQPLLDVLANELDGPDPPVRLYVGLQRPDRGVVSLLGSGVLRRRFPSLAGSPVVFLQGSDRAMTVPTASYRYGFWSPRPERLDPSELKRVGRALVVVDSHAREGGGWRAWDGSVGPLRSAPGLGQRGWDFRRTPGGWEGWQSGAEPTARWVEGEGWRLTSARRLSEVGLGYALAVPGNRSPDALVSHPLRLPATMDCGLRLYLRNEGAASFGGVGHGLLGGSFALLSLLSEDDVDLFAKMTVLPLEPGDQAIDVLFETFPAWREAGTIDRIGLSAAGVGGELLVERIELLPCAPPPPEASLAALVHRGVAAGDPAGLDRRPADGSVDSGQAAAPRDLRGASRQPETRN